MQALSSSRKGIKAQAGYGAISNEAPVLSLPIEIACLIFREAHLAIEANREDDQIRVHLTEVAISHVCQQWRSTAIGLPILWSSFYYHGPSATYATLRRFEMYLKRSRSHTLELVMDFRQPIRDWELNVAVLDMALTAVSRWRLVSIFSLDTTSNFIRLKLKELHAPHLEHLTLFPNVSFDSGVNLTLKHSIGPHIFAEGAPRLKSVWVDTSAPNLYLPPLSAVTTLRIENGRMNLVFSLDTLRAILTLPNLENLSMFETWCESTNVMGGTPEVVPLILMKRLKHLRLSDNVPVLHLLKIVRAPLLETIMSEYTFSSGNDRHAQGGIYSFPSLASLVLFDIRFESLDSLRIFMEMTSAVRHLTIVHRNSRVIDGVLGKMPYSSDQNPSPVWPHLETLTIDSRSNGMDILIEDVLPMFLKSHQRGDAGLTLRISDTRARGWKQVGYPQMIYATFAELCTIEKVPVKELYDPMPWPPGGDGVLGRRIDLEAVPFAIKPILDSPAFCQRTF